MKIRGSIILLMAVFALLLGAIVPNAAAETRGAEPLIFSHGFENLRPIADAGGDRNATINIITSLNGSGSVDPDGDDLSYQWQLVSQPAGSVISLVSANSIAPSFTPTHIGLYVFGLVVSDGQLASLADQITITVIATVIAPTADAGPDQSVLRGTQVQLNGSASSDPQARPLTYAWAIVLQPAGSNVDLSAATTAMPSFMPEIAGLYRVSLTVGNGVLSSTPAFAEVAALLPPPAETASAIDPTEITSVGESTAFLYTGAEPIQIGVTPGAIADGRAAVLRGRVLDAQAQGLAGVTVQVLGRPEFGQTLSQSDGQFDLAVDGGGQFVVQFTRDGMLTVQRRVASGWNGQERLPDAVMIPPDPSATQVDLRRSSGIHIVRGSSVVDRDGWRRGRLFVPPALNAQMQLPNGQRRAIQGTATFRITEFTDLDLGGARAMPGELPATTSFTYAAELSLDEALAARATRVDFDQPIPFFVENFQKFPVGSPVPLGYYDRQRAEWIPAPNGRVIQILSIGGGEAVLDVTGNGLPATPAELDELGIDILELEYLAAEYEAGVSLWRSLVDHFTPWDCNWPRVPPAGAQPPRMPPPMVGGNPARTSPDRPAGEESPGECASAPGSIIQCQKQTMQKGMPIAGTPFALHYSSERTPGWQANNAIQIRLSGASMPPGILRIELGIHVAGRVFTQEFLPSPNLSHTFVWDGKDAYERTLSGSQEVKVEIGYVYPALYALPGEFEQSFSTLSGVPIIGNRAREEITLRQEHHFQIGAPSVSQIFGIGGWSLTPHHFYDPNRRTVFQGDGEIRETAATVSDLVISKFAGTGSSGYGGDTGPATQASISNPRGVAVGADGAVYFADTFNHRVRRIAPNGTITTIAGTGTDGFSGDGGIATTARLFAPTDVAVGRDGSVYISDSYNHRIRVVLPTGVITTLVGNGQEGFSGDGGPAVAATLNFPSGVALGPFGDIYIADAFNHRIRRVGANGVITTVAGTGVAGFSGDDGPAILAQLEYPLDLDVSPDGDQYVVDNVNHRIRKINTGGIITTFAGTGEQGFSGDGGPATAAKLAFPRGIALMPDGALLVVDGSNRRIRIVNGEGVITTVMGGGTQTSNGGLGLQYHLQFPSGIAVAPDGRIIVSDTGAERIVAGARFLPRYSAGELLIASTDGAETYRFSATGRHLETIDAYTRATILSFAYDASGRLISITDGDGDTTVVERNGSGAATAIISEDGQRTDLTIADGLLAEISNPNGEADIYAYGPGGLLTSATNARNFSSTYSYDAQGRLTSVENDAQGGLTLTRIQTGPDYQVTRTSALNRITTYGVTHDAVGDQQRNSVFPDGSSTLTSVSRDGVYASSLSDGTTLLSRVAPDPRFGLQSAFSSAQQTSTGGKTSVVTGERLVSLANPNDPLSLQSLTEIATINGRTGTNGYNAGTRTWTRTTPASRTTTTVVDPFGRPVRSSTPGLADVQMIYDSRGRLSEVFSGTGPTERRTIYTYGPDGFLLSVRDPIEQTVTFGRDLVGRVEQMTRPDEAVVSFGYDANGNLNSVSPPGRPAHTFEHTAVDQVERYRPPAVQGVANPETIYAYNRDQQPTTVTRPDGRALNFGYDTAGRLSTLSVQRGTFTTSYLPTTGQLSGITAPGGIGLGYSYNGGLQTRTTWTGPISGRVDYTYDNDFRVASISVNGATVINLGYDADSLLTSAGSLTLSYDPANALLNGTTIGAIVDSYGYSEFGEVAGYEANHSGSPLFNESYGRDKLGRITQEIETIAGIIKTFDYRYDPAGRLVEVKTDGVVTAEYVYDDNGNRLSRTASGNTFIGTYDVQDRMTAYAGSTYAYTAEGELSRKTTGAQFTDYSYDELGNLLQVTNPDGTVVAYRIDGQNRRIGKLINGAAVQGFLYQDQLKPIAELNGSGSLVARFIYADKVNVPAYMLKGGQTYRFVTDHLGSPRLIVNTATGQVAQRLDYDEFGNVTQDTNPGFQPFGYAGGIYDRDTGLIRFGARDYDSTVGRWISKDVAGAEAVLNVYAYALNDPISYVDPTGEFPWMLVFVAAEFALQASQHGTDWQCYDWTGIALSAVGGGAFKAGVKIAQMARAGSAARTASTILNRTPQSLQKFFTKPGHGAAFGLKGNWSPSRGAEASRAIHQHINSPAVRTIEGTYRGNPVTHYIDPKTGLNVIATPNGNFISGWRLGAEQLEGVLATGRLF